MSDETRLERALAAAAAPARDGAFVMAVLERAERERFRHAAAWSALRGAGLTSAACAVLVLLMNWAAAQLAAVVTDGLLLAAALLGVVIAARLLASRVGARAA